MLDKYFDRYLKKKISEALRQKFNYKKAQKLISLIEYYQREACNRENPIFIQLDKNVSAYLQEGGANPANFLNLNTQYKEKELKIKRENEDYQQRMKSARGRQSEPLEMKH